jgi:hypothetical protein
MEVDMADNGTVGSIGGTAEVAGSPFSDALPDGVIVSSVEGRNAALSPLLTPMSYRSLYPGRGGLGTGRDGKLENGELDLTAFDDSFSDISEETVNTQLPNCRNILRQLL